MDRKTYELVIYPFSQSRQEAEVTGLADTAVQDLDAYRILSRSAQSRVNRIRDDYLTKILGQVSDAVTQADARGMLPPLSKRFVQEFDARAESIFADQSNPLEQVTLAIASAAAIIVETRFAVAATHDLQHSFFASAVQAEIASYMSWKASDEVNETASASISSILRNFEEERRAVMSGVLTQVEEANQKLVQLQNADIEFRGRLQKTWNDWEATQGTVSNSIEKAKAQIDHLSESAAKAASQIRLTDDNIAAFKSAMIEEVRGAETRKLWLERDRESWGAFAISGLLLAGLLLVVPTVGFIELEWVLATLKRTGDAAAEGIPSGATGTQLAVAAISRLVVITFPIALYFWVIKLVVRFNSRSLLLHDDARQRQTMMDTYFVLIERQAASAEERALILNALFRPAPGYGPDNIEPPNFTEVLGKATPKGD